MGLATRRCILKSDRHTPAARARPVRIPAQGLHLRHRHRHRDSTLFFILLRALLWLVCEAGIIFCRREELGDLIVISLS